MRLLCFYKAFSYNIKLIIVLLFYVIISRCDAYYFLSNSSPTLESVPARYYELILNSNEYTGFTESINLADFYKSILSSTSQPVAILGRCKY